MDTTELWKDKGRDLGKSGAKLTLRGVPQHYKLAFTNGYWEGRKTLPATRKLI